MNASMERIRTVIWKEWRELRHNRVVLLTFLFLPTFLTGWSVSILFVPLHGKGSVAEQMAKLPAGIAAKVTTPEEGGALMVASMAIMMFLLIPSILPSVLTTHAIIGEKQSRSLEPLLATPLRTWELLSAKMLASWLPSVIPPLVGYGIYLAVASHRMPPRVFGIVTGPEWVLTVVFLGPLLAVMSVCLALLVSSRVTDLQAAQALGGLVALPIVGFGLGQMFTAALVSVPVVFGLCAVLLLLDAGLMGLCVTMFERESILTRWK
jgi:ABC-2 type transport system permease protein